MIIVTVNRWCAAGTAVALAVLAGCGTTASQPTSGSSAVNSAVTASSVTTPTVAANVGRHNTTDVEFASTLAELTDQGRAIAALAQNRADHPALHGLATEVQGRAHDVDTLRAWQQDWGQQPGPATTITSPSMLSPDDLRALSELRGGAFEDAWLEHMAGNYTAAIAWCQRELNQGVNPQARGLATGWLGAMNDELGSVRQWHTEWGHHPNPAATAIPAQPAPPPTTSSIGPTAGAAHPDDNQHMTPTTHPQQSPHPTDGLHAKESQHMDSSGHMDDSHG